MSRIDTHAFGLWWRLAKGWLSRKFDSISIDLTPVEEKLDDVKSDVADVKTAVEHIDFSTLAKQGTDQTATLTAIKELLAGGGDPDIPEGVAERLAAIMQFFNISGTVPSQYHEMEDTEVLEIADEEWLAMYGFVAVQNTLHTVNPLGQQVEIATYFKTSRTYGDYGFPELWAQNDQQQWVSILNDNPTADRDIYTYNPSNNE